MAKVELRAIRNSRKQKIIVNWTMEKLFSLPDPFSIHFPRVLLKTIEGDSYVPSKSHDKSVDSAIGRYFS